MRLQLNISHKFVWFNLFIGKRLHVYMETGIESYDVHMDTEQKVCI